MNMMLSKRDSPENKARGLRKSVGSVRGSPSKRLSISKKTSGPNVQECGAYLGDQSVAEMIKGLAVMGLIGGNGPPPGRASSFRSRRDVTPTDGYVTARENFDFESGDDDSFEGLPVSDSAERQLRREIAEHIDVSHCLETSVEATHPSGDLLPPSPLLVLPPEIRMPTPRTSQIMDDTVLIDAFRNMSFTDDTVTDNRTLGPSMQSLELPVGWAASVIRAISSIGNRPSVDVTRSHSATAVDNDAEPLHASTRRRNGTARRRRPVSQGHLWPNPTITLSEYDGTDSWSLMTSSDITDDWKLVRRPLLHRAWKRARVFTHACFGHPTPLTF